MNFLFCQPVRVKFTPVNHAVQGWCALSDLSFLAAVDIVPHGAVGGGSSAGCRDLVKIKVYIRGHTNDAR